MRSPARVVARNSVFILASKFLIKFISFAFIIIIARTLGDVGFGRYALVWSYVATFAAFSDFGLATYIIRELARKQSNNNSLAENVIAFRLILAVATILLINFSIRFTDYSSETFSQIVLASSILLLYAVQDPLDSILQAKERADLSSILRIIGQLAFVGLGAVFLFSGWGVNGLILAALCNVLITGVLSWYLIQQYLGGLRWQLQPKLWPKLLLISLPFGIIGFAINWTAKIDTVILSLYWPDEMIGWYNGAYNLILGMVVISNSFNVALYPTMSKETTTDYLTLGKMYQRVFKYLFIVSLPLAAGISILSRPIILLFYGASFAPAIVPLAILAWGLPLIFASEFSRYVTLVLGRENTAAVAVISASLINILLNFLLIPRYGSLAAASTTVLTEALLVGIYFWQLRKEISLLSIGSVLWRPTLASSLMLGILQLSSHASLAMLLVLGVTTYVSVLLLLGSVDPEEGSFLREVLGRVWPIISHSS